MPTKRIRTQMDDERKDHIDPEGPKQRNRPKQLQTHNFLTNDVKNVNSTNKGRGIAELLYIDKHIMNKSKSRRKKSSYGPD